MKTEIQEFIRLTDEYIDQGERYGQVSSTAQEKTRKGENAQGLIAVMPQYWEEFEAARQAFLDAALPIAEALERDGHDSAGVLAMYGEADTQRIGHWRRLFDAWVRLKPELQRMAIRQLTDEKGGNSTDTTDTKTDTEKINGRKNDQ